MWTAGVSSKTSSRDSFWHAYTIHHVQFQSFVWPGFLQAQSQSSSGGEAAPAAEPVKYRKKQKVSNGPVSAPTPSASGSGGAAKKGPEGATPQPGTGAQNAPQQDLNRKAQMMLDRIAPSLGPTLMVPAQLGPAQVS